MTLIGNNYTKKHPLWINRKSSFFGSIKIIIISEFSYKAFQYKDKLYQIQ